MECESRALETGARDGLWRRKREDAQQAPDQNRWVREENRELGSMCAQRAREACSGDWVVRDGCGNCQCRAGTECVRCQTGARQVPDRWRLRFYAALRGLYLGLGCVSIQRGWF